MGKNKLFNCRKHCGVGFFFFVPTLSTSSSFLIPTNKTMRTAPYHIVYSKVYKLYEWENCFCVYDTPSLSIHKQIIGSPIILPNENTFIRMTSVHQKLFHRIIETRGATNTNQLTIRKFHQRVNVILLNVTTNLCIRGLASWRCK